MIHSCNSWFDTIPNIYKVSSDWGDLHHTHVHTSIYVYINIYNIYIYIYIFVYVYTHVYVHKLLQFVEGSQFWPNKVFPGLLPLWLRGGVIVGSCRHKCLGVWYGEGKEQRKRFSELDAVDFLKTKCWGCVLCMHIYIYIYIVYNSTSWISVVHDESWMI